MILPKQAPPVQRTTQGDWIAGRWVPWYRMTAEQQKSLWNYVRSGGWNSISSTGYC